MPVPTRFTSWSASFSGYLSEFALLDVIQLVDLAQKSGVLSLTFADETGRIDFSRGEMRSATFGAIENEEAVYRMLEQREGSFSFQQRQVDRPRRMRLNNAAILMEGCRRLDEA